MPLQVKANCGLHSLAKGMKKKALAMSMALKPLTIVPFLYSYAGKLRMSPDLQVP